MRATLVWLFAMHYLRSAAVVAVLAACPFAVKHEAQRTKPPARKSPADRSTAESGRKTFESVCAGCHGLDGRGGERGPNIATRAEVRSLTDEETLQILQSGMPAAGMPAFASLGASRIKGVIAYLRILQGENEDVFVPRDAHRGESLFF